jgi:hypothetical protein
MEKIIFAFPARTPRWLKPRQNFKVGDIVIVAEEETSRHCWP